MEKYFKSQHALVDSKLNSYKTILPAETENTASAVDGEPIWKPRAFNNVFPRTQRVRRHHITYRRRQCSPENIQSSFVPVNGKRLHDSGNVINMYVPRLPVNNCYEDSRSDTIKRTYCSFVTNNKMYLKKRGVNINNLYSFKQSRRRPNDKTTKNESDLSVGKYVSTNSKTANASDYFKHLTRDSSQCQSKPSTSSIPAADNKRYARLMKGLEREAIIPGHVRAEETKGNHLGKVLAKTQLGRLLRQEQSAIWPDFSVK
jgi:hypothetical protein